MSPRPTIAEQSADIYGAAEELHAAVERVEEARDLMRRAGALTSTGALSRLIVTLRANATELEHAADELMEDE